MKNLMIGLCMFFLMAGISWSQEVTLRITDMKAEPDPVAVGGIVLISCRVNHSQGSEFIDRIAATAYFGQWITGYPRLYDDGTRGDITSRDGVYSLLVRAADVPGVEKIIFIAVDKDRKEIESEPIFLTVK